MTWQGVPFAFNLDSINQTLLRVGQIPTVHVDTGFGWDTLFGSIVAGAIPAFIAWYTIKKNLAALEKDRAEQQSTFDKDRDAQLNIAAKNLNAQVLSNNRQQWINYLRKSISEFVSLSASAIQHKVTWYLHVKDIPIRSVTEPLGRDFLNGFFKEKYQMVGLATEIKLMLNPAENDSKAIIKYLDRINSLMDDGNLVNFYEFGSEVKVRYDSCVEELTQVAQKCLKAEWDRVKQVI